MSTSYTKFRLYYEQNQDKTYSKILDVPVQNISERKEIDLISYNFQLHEDLVSRDSNSGELRRIFGRIPMAYAYQSSKGYSITKLVKPARVEKIEIYSGDEIIRTIYQYTKNSAGAKQYSKEFYYPGIVRFNLTEDESIYPEVDIHEYTYDSHYNKMKYSFFESQKDSMIRKEFIRGLTNNNIAEVINGNLLTKSYQIFHLGSLINDRYTMEK